ncbi:transposase, partial [Arsenicicoccus cauae]|uniref:transposase n=1 Tax=Arsenicicoccus cauae TaxID=2663847 RepID=UPI0024C07F57
MGWGQIKPSQPPRRVASGARSGRHDGARSTCHSHATGVTEHGRREILGLDVGDSEDEVFWRAFLIGLKKRGLGGVQ